uniref:VWFA domain-containing protein n=1 Tax=Marseillevirus LCMAC103 TaxID=2506604 RepID=A0A481YUB6_9VIRU|nr:MAG: hypothetical protein LCMAC103_01300 [Marseillevirus LCMAC103]
MSCQPATFDAPPAYDPGLGLQYGILDWDQQAADALVATLERLEISSLFSCRIKFIQGAKMVFALDDSGSMNSPSDDPNSNTRWDELRNFICDALSIYGGVCVGVDFYFLNRGCILQPDGTYAAGFYPSVDHPYGTMDPNLPKPYAQNVKTFAQVDRLFDIKPGPHDLTPLSDTFEMVKTHNADIDCELIINTVTDGEPGVGWNSPNPDDLERFGRVVTDINETTFCNFRLCTNSDRTVKKYNEWDVGKPRVDVNDDYKKERVEVKERKGIDMTPGEYLLKCTLGAADKTPGAENFDKWDEDTPAPKPRATQRRPPGSGGCGCTVM